MKTIKYILLLLPFIGMGQIQIDSLEFMGAESYNGKLLKFYKPTKKEFQYQYVYSTIYLMDLYMESLKKEKVHIGWEFISNEHTSSGGDSWYTSQRLYYKVALDYIEPYEYDHEYMGKIAYDLREDIPIEEYGYVLDRYGIMEYDRTEKIMVNKKPSFEDFYNWTKKYFKDEKDSFRVVIEQ